MCLAAAVAAPHAQTTEPGTGTIAGHVKLTARVRSPLASNVYPSRTIGKHAGPTIPEIRNVTWIDLPTSHWPMWSKPQETARIIGDVASAAS